MKKLLITLIALMTCSTVTFAQWYANKSTNGMIHVSKTKSYQQFAPKGSCQTVKYDKGSSEKITIPVQLVELSNSNMKVLEEIGSYTVYVDCPNNKCVFINNTNKNLTIDIQVSPSEGILDIFHVSAGPGQTSTYTMRHDYHGKNATFHRCRLNTCNGYSRKNNAQMLN